MSIRIVYLLLLSLILSGECLSQKLDRSYIQTNYSPCTYDTEDLDSIQVTLRLSKATADKWILELNLFNSGEQSVFVMTEPIQSDGSNGPYLTIDKDDPSTLDISIRAYPPPHYTLYVDHTVMKLKQLEPHASYTETFSIALPLEETVPPYRDIPTKRVINLKSIKYIKASIGVLPFEDGIKEFLRRKREIGPYANGIERLTEGSFKGKRIFDVQTLAHSKRIQLKS